MELIHLEEFHQLCPNTKNLFIEYIEDQKEHLKHLLKFKELEILKFTSGQYISVQPFLLYLKSLKDDNKLISICFPAEIGIETDKGEVCEFFKLLFEKVKPTKLEGIRTNNSILSSASLISNWIENNSTIQQLNLNSKPICDFISSS
jgi:hypothetical protein